MLRDDSRTQTSSMINNNGYKVVVLPIQVMILYLYTKYYVPL